MSIYFWFDFDLFYHRLHDFAYSTRNHCASPRSFAVTLKNFVLMSAEKPAEFPMSQVYELGKVTVFYIPCHKLVDPRYYHSTTRGERCFLVQRKPH